MWIGYLCAVIGSVIFGLALYESIKESRRLRAERESLLGGTTRLLKEIDRLEKELDKYKDGNLKIELTKPERHILLNALESPQYKARITDPKTKRFIRIIYNTLRKKIQDSIKE